MFHDFTNPEFRFSHSLPAWIPVVTRQSARRINLEMT
jgi:hypothetical protein